MSMIFAFLTFLIEEEFDNHYTDLAHYGKTRFWDHRYSVYFALAYYNFLII